METGKHNFIKTVCIYCASSTHIDDTYFELAAELGQLLSARGVDIVNGAGSTGLMRAVSDAALEGGSKVTGVIPQFMVERGWHHPSLSNLVVTADMHERKQRMAAMSQGVIALPGGCGTLEELLEVITWKQLGIYPHPIIIFNANHYYDALLQMLDHAIANRFMHPCHAGLWCVAESAVEAVNLLFSTPLWQGCTAKYK